MMIENKQTAIDWFFAMLIEYNYLNKDVKHLLKVAKEMEKEQIIDAHNNRDNKSATLYYNETFK
jgi:predicted neutral ceramidase superfamily lipid hydrolase